MVTIYPPIWKMLKADYDDLTMDPKYASGDGEKIKFLTRSGLEKCQVFLINGKFYHYDDSDHAGSL